MPVTSVVISNTLVVLIINRDRKTSVCSVCLVQSVMGHVKFVVRGLDIQLPSNGPVFESKLETAVLSGFFARLDFDLDLQSIVFDFLHSTTVLLCNASKLLD